MSKFDIAKLCYVHNPVSSLFPIHSYSIFGTTTSIQFDKYASTGLLPGLPMTSADWTIILYASIILLTFRVQPLNNLGWLLYLESEYTKDVMSFEDFIVIFKCNSRPVYIWMVFLYTNTYISVYRSWVRPIIIINR